MSAIGPLTLAMTLTPAAAIILIVLIGRPRAAEAINLVASAVSLLSIVLILVLAPSAKSLFWGGYVIIDGLGGWTILCAAIVYFLGSVYAIGYMRLLGETDRLPHFYAMFAGFALTTLVGPMMNNAGLYWIAIELTTLVSTFLVAFEREAASIEAAWKYIIVVSAGISLALLGTILFYWSGTFVLGPTYDMTWDALREAAPHLNSALVALSFLLVLIGFGTKVGLAPMHTWLPDAHSEGPAPVSALLSGALLNTAMVGIVRYLAVADAAGISIPGAQHASRARRILAFRRCSFHRPPDRHQTADGLLQRGTYGRNRIGVRVRRSSRRCRGAVSHVKSFAKQIRDVLRRGQRDARLWHQANPEHSLSHVAFSSAWRVVASGSGRNHRRAAIRAVLKRTDNHPRGSRPLRAIPRRAYGRPSHRDLRWVLEPFSSDVLRRWSPCAKESGAD